MTKLTVLRAFAAGATGLALATSVGAVGASSQNYEVHSSHIKNGIVIRNDNDVKVKNTTNQDAKSGRAEVEHNKDGGSAATGDATNANKTTTLGVSIENASCGCDSAPTFEAGEVSATNLKVNNDNNVHVYNTTTQTAKSGNAEVEHNKSGGDATTGNASNMNETSITVSISN